MGGFAYDLERQAVLKEDIPEFEVGDSIDVHVRITEGDKSRVQVFSGVVIARKHQGLRETVTVRRVVAGEGVERIFPLHSPFVEKFEITRRGKVRRAKLYYLRERVGKETRIKEDLKRSRVNEVDVRRNAAPKPEAPAAEEAEAKQEAPEGADAAQNDAAAEAEKE